MSIRYLYIRNYSYLVLFFLVFCFGCKKDTLETTKNNPPAGDNYSSINDFYQQNAVAVQTFPFNSAAGANFTTSQGTHVTVPADAFVTLSGVHDSGTVSLQ